MTRLEWTASRRTMGPACAAPSGPLPSRAIPRQTWRMANPPEPTPPPAGPPTGPAQPPPGWSEEDWAYAVEGHDPPPPRRSVVTSGRLTGILALVAVVLLAIAVLPSLGLALPRISIEFGPGPSPSPTAQPTAGPSATPSGEPSFVRPTPTAAPTFMSYVVKQGDSLGTIATVFRTTARSIAWWNRGTYPSLDPESPTYNPQVIQPGWTLALIPGVVVDDANPPSPSPGRNTPSPAASGSPATGGSPGPSGSPAPASPSPRPSS